MRRGVGDSYRSHEGEVALDGTLRGDDGLRLGNEVETLRPNLPDTDTPNFERTVEGFSHIRLVLVAIYIERIHSASDLAFLLLQLFDVLRQHNNIFLCLAKTFRLHVEQALSDSAACGQVHARVRFEGPERTSVVDFSFPQFFLFGRIKQICFEHQT
jgi:hypothetical protein